MFSLDDIATLSNGFFEHDKITPPSALSVKKQNVAQHVNKRIKNPKNPLNFYRERALLELFCFGSDRDVGSITKILTGFICADSFKKTYTRFVVNRFGKSRIVTVSGSAKRNND